MKSGDIAVYKKCEIHFDDNNLTSTYKKIGEKNCTDQYFFGLCS